MLDVRQHQLFSEIRIPVTRSVRIFYVVCNIAFNLVDTSFCHSFTNFVEACKWLEMEASQLAVDSLTKRGLLFLGTEFPSHLRNRYR